MSHYLGPTRVTAPDGAEWLVGRRWTSRPLGRSRRRPRELVSDSLSGLSLPDVPTVDSAEGLLLITLAAILIVLLVPILFFGVELLIAGGLIAAGVAGRVLLRQPWIIEARTIVTSGTERRLEWEVRGWRRSDRLLKTVVSDLSAGREPELGDRADRKGPALDD